MSVWAQIQSLPESFQRRILSIYNQSQTFPVEVRRSLAEWIEQQDWTLNNQTSHYDSNLVDKCCLLLQSFAEQLQTLLSRTIDISEKFKIDSFFGLIDSSLKSGNFDIIMHIYECLRQEKVIIHRYQEGLNESNPGHFGILEQKCQENRQKILAAENLLKNANSTKENIIISNSQMVDLQNSLSRFAINSDDYIARHNKIIEINNQISLFSNHYEQTKKELNMLHEQIIHDLEQILIILLQDLNTWKYYRKQMQTSETYENFRQMVDICQMLAHNICLLWPQIKKIETLLCNNAADLVIPLDHCVTVKAKIVSILKTLVNATFIVENQPGHQVIKTNTKLKKMVVHLLVGNIFQMQQMNPAVVKVTIINEQQAKQMYNNFDAFPPNTCSGEILNNTSLMEYNPSNKLLSANFVNLQLKKIKRTEKKASESVMDEKSALLFSSELCIDEDLKFSVKAISDPVVVIVHVNQEAHAQATITWDTAFAEPTRIPFEVPQEVKFSRLAEVLSQKFLENTGRPLSDDNLNLLAEKIFDTYQPDRNAMVSWSRFSKEHMTGHNFTFWDWFYAILKLTSEHVRDIWYEGHIIGFIHRQRAEELLLNDRPIGTFLLRFSDTKPGGISIAYVEEHAEPTGKVVTMVDPFCSSDLKLRKLADRLRDLSDLTYLYPNIPKDNAFGHYYTQVNNQTQTSNGYVRPMLVNYIPRFGNSNSNRFGSPSAQLPNNFNYSSDLLPNFNYPCDNSNFSSASIDNIFDVDF